MQSALWSKGSACCTSLSCSLTPRQEAMEPGIAPPRSFILLEREPSDTRKGLSALVHFNRLVMSMVMGQDCRSPLKHASLTGQSQSGYPLQTTTNQHHSAKLKMVMLIKKKGRVFYSPLSGYLPLSISKQRWINIHSIFLLDVFVCKYKGVLSVTLIFNWFWNNRRLSATALSNKRQQGIFSCFCGHGGTKCQTSFPILFLWRVEDVANSWDHRCTPYKSEALILPLSSCYIAPTFL